MKRILMSVMTIAVVGGLMGSAVADFSDIEISKDNYFAVGALDLKVSDYMGTEYQDPNVPAFCTFEDGWPCCNKSFFFDLENYGQGSQKDPHAYVHFKNYECGWVVPANIWKWLDEDGNPVPAPDPEPVAGTRGTGYPKPVNEPEFVAECGGIAGEDKDGNAVVVPGIGLYGEECQLSKHIGIRIEMAGPYPLAQKPETSSDVPDADWTQLDLVAMGYDTNGDGVVKMNEVECKQIYLGTLPDQWGMWIHVALHFQDFDEEDAYDEGLIPTTYFDEDYPEAKWDHWPTNAMQKDVVNFDMAFELLQTDRKSVV